MSMIVGIDLGTTHCGVAFCDVDADVGPTLFEMPQLVAQGQAATRPLLPSCLYAPIDDEAPEARWQLQLDGVAGSWLVGEHARARGGEVTQRLVSSAKSWLSYSRVDRRAAILPWQLAGDPDEGDGEATTPRLSPVAASALLLSHIKRCWDDAHPAAALAQQDVVLTVPASFDAVARELTVEAARSIGLEVRLLEEPQAAFYDLMRVGGEAVLEQLLSDGDEARVLVCDVGGGTTDLSLMKVGRDRDGVTVERVAVGKHLLLGGDNMDLALAHLCERRLVAEGDRLEQRRFCQLVGACRAAKERLLSEDAPSEVNVTLVGSGSKLIGGALKPKLTRQEVAQVVLDGFVPEVSLAEPRAVQARGGIVAFGLPYERDVAITRHLAEFVRRQADHQPTALLLNGGVFRSPAVAGRVADTLRRWTDGRARLLALTDPDTSVALGAVAYGLALRGRARRIRGGAAKSYYLGLDGSEPRAVCVLSRGVDEGVLQRADAHAMDVTVGRKVRFDLYAADRYDEVGAVVPLDDDHQRLAPLVTKLTDHGGSTQRRVVLEAELSAIGTLDLRCVDVGVGDGKRRFALAFDLRVDDGASVAHGAGHEQVSATARYGKRLDEARQVVAGIYSKKTRKQVAVKEVKGLVRRLERIFGKRKSWDATLNRTLFDLMWTFQRGRKTGADHERVFWMLAGFCLRPGAGHARDGERVTAMFEQFPQRLAHGKEPRSWQQFWIAWRRVSGGLDESAQVAIRDVVDPFLAPADKGLKPAKPWRNDMRWEMLELAASLERVPAVRRGELGGWIVEHTWTERDARLWSALGRVGARTPVYASAHHVVAARTIERWMDHLLREKWEEIPSAPRAAVSMCRVTGDRARDVSDVTRDKVATRLESLGVPAAKILPVRELIALDDRDRADFYGEDLPGGLSLADDAPS